MINFPDIQTVLATSPENIASMATVIGQSREGRDVLAYRLGGGCGKARRISLIGGCHADEPVGPMLLRHWVAYLLGLPKGHELLSAFEWWIVPHANPDGAARNDKWASTLKSVDDAYDLLTYLRGVQRELPGDDMEFGFPRDEHDQCCRPENLAIARWWGESSQNFLLHASLHGMQRGGGPWFLMERDWNARCDILKRECREAVLGKGYELHDVERQGEKGFFRLGQGFCSRPDSALMREHFLGLGDNKMAERFRPSSMEAIRRFGGDPLTLVSEMPLFVTPGVGRAVGEHGDDPLAVAWQAKFERWYGLLGKSGGGDVAALAALKAEVAQSGLQPMKVVDQLYFQWVFVASGINQAMMFDSKSILNTSVAFRSHYLQADQEEGSQEDP